MLPLADDRRLEWSHESKKIGGRGRTRSWQRTDTYRHRHSMTEVDTTTGTCSLYILDRGCMSAKFQNGAYKVLLEWPTNCSNRY